MPSFLRLLLLVLVAACASCTFAPKTPQQAYTECRVVPQPGGGVVVVGPELPFTVRGANGVASFQALIDRGETVFFQKTYLRSFQEPYIIETTRARLETFRRTGTVVTIQNSSVRVPFPPAYFEGFLRKVDSVAAGAR